DLKDKRDEQFKKLSGGLKQRVGLAVSLVNDPSLVFLDEPTTGLDPRARRDVWGVIERLKSQGKTVFLTTHYMDEAEYLADIVSIIDHGQIIASGTPNELIDSYGGKKTLIIRNAAESSPSLLLNSRAGTAAGATYSGLSHSHYSSLFCLERYSAMEAPSSISTCRTGT